MAIAGERPVVFRLLDIGGDKVLPYQRSMAEENPAMGFRSIRLGLERPGLLRTQIRALLLAADGRPLKILVPMVTETFEFTPDQAGGAQGSRAAAPRRARPIPSRLELGVMVEVPSLLFELDQLLPEADFVSIGSNDLVQFLTASDRANPRVAKNYDPIGMPRLRAIRLVVDAARRYNIPITMCGELAGKPLEALALMAIGMTRLSHGAGLDRADQGAGAQSRSQADPAVGRRGAERWRRWRHHPAVAAGMDREAEPAGLDACSAAQPRLHARCHPGVGRDPS